jgi:Lrp/AsnC family leucine-responsive transcriptional regulator
VEDLDEHDRQILRLLGDDGRMSYTDLAKATKLSTSAVHQRVRRLEQRGVIKGYSAIIDIEAIGLPLTAFISVSPIDPADPDDIADRLAPLSAVEGCYSVAGDQNYVLKVRVASPAALEALLSDIRSTAHVTSRTTVVLSIPFEHRPPVV